jgi:phosphoserine phosphatase RsbU/P
MLQSANAQAQNEERVTPAPGEATAARTASILVVDDVSANLQVLSGMLRDRGYKVRPVPSGELALVAARKYPPDLILLDINMPDMNGYEVCRRLKAEETLQGIPVIFISALNENLDKLQAFGTGGVDYITKPFQMEELHARVETHLKLRRLQVELEEANKRLEQANGRMSRDLEAAAKIQKTFLPCATPRIPGTQFVWCYQPCDELAGDGLSIIPLDEGRVGFYILDVSGHGVAAALLSVTLSRLLSPPSEPSSILIRDRTVLDHAAHDPLDVTPPAEIADRLNRLFPFDTATEQFATLVYGILDVATGDFRYVSAGHPGPLHLPAEGPPIILDSPGFPIGLSDEVYAERCVHLAAGDRLYLYSDGLPDAMNTRGEQFGESRLVEAVHRGRAKPLREGIATLLAEISRWRGGGRPQDDMSILAVELAAAPSPCNPACEGVADAISLYRENQARPTE